MNAKLKLSLLVVITILLLPNARANNIKTTSNSKELNCIVDTIHSLEGASDDFKRNIQLCADVQDNYVIDNISKLQRIAVKIVNLNAKICNNESHNISDDPGKKSSQLCQHHMTKLLSKLRKVIKDTSKEIHDVKNSNSCATMALAKYNLDLNNFNNLVKKCADEAKNN